MKEQWKDIENYPNYQVSDLGSVRNKLTGKLLRLVKDKYGYMSVCLCKDGAPKRVRIHRLVATSFIPNPDNKRTINHINGCKTDNYVSNLEWSTYSENNIHSIKTGLRTKSGSPKQRVRCIETQQVFESQHDAARYFGCNQCSIHSSIYKGIRCKGLHFEKI